MKSLKGFDFAALRRDAAALFPEESVRHYALDALDEVLNDVIVPRALLSAGRKPILEQELWMAALDPETADIVFVRTDGSDAPEAWVADAARMAKKELDGGGAPPDEDAVIRLAEKGVATLALLAFGRRADGVTALYGSHPEADEGMAAALAVNMTELFISLRHGIN